MRVHRVGTTERQLFQDSLRRERVVVDDPQHTGMVRELYPTDGAADETSEGAEQADPRVPMTAAFSGTWCARPWSDGTTF